MDGPVPIQSLDECSPLAAENGLCWCRVPSFETTGRQLGRFSTFPLRYLSFIRDRKSEG